LGRNTGEEEIDFAIGRVTAAVKQLREEGINVGMWK